MKRLIVMVAACLCVACGERTDAVRYPSVTDATGCLVEQITAATYDEYQVQGVSSDGRLLSFSSNYGEDADGNALVEVHILDLDTGSKTLLPDAINNSGNFSTDSQYLVVAANDQSGRTEILELHIGSGEVTTIAPHDQWDWLPSYSPDGRFIVFNSYRHESQSDIYLYERATGGLRRLTDDPEYDAHAQFSADGDRIMFHRMMGPRANDRYVIALFVHDLTTGSETLLTDSPYDESYAAFAPDGRHIVFSSDAEEEPEQYNLYVRAPDGRTTALTDGPWTDYYAYWTRDGDYIYFNSNLAGVSNVHRIRMDGFSCARATAE